MWRTIRYGFATVKTLYQILEVGSLATVADIRKNYLKLAKIYHPDQYRGKDKQRFEQIQLAYATLSNRAKRSEYDASIGLSKEDPTQKIKSESNEKAKTEEQTEAQPESKNNFTYEEASKLNEEDIDREYQEFFAKKSETRFEEIRLKETPEFRQMNMAERVRRRFVDIYGDRIREYKAEFQQSYPYMLDDTVDQINEHVAQNEEERINRPKRMRRKKIVRNISIFIAIILISGIGLSYYAKHQRYTEIRNKINLKNEKKILENEMLTIRARILL